jgi:hypothetical protein
MIRTTIVMAAALALVAILPTVSAQAQAPRTFVSAAGTDNPTCSFAAPCRHFQAAVTATSAGGEVDALDPAGYGPITISQAVTIEGQGWSYIAPPASGNGITINAGSGNVIIHGVSLNGVGITGTTNGIVLNSAGSLTVSNCIAQNFSDDGILMAPTFGTLVFSITNTTVSNNGEDGVQYIPPSGSPSATIVIDHVVATANGNGIVVDTRITSGGTAVAISNSVASANGNSGLAAINNLGPLTVSIDNVSVVGNGETGIGAVNSTKVLLTRSVIHDNPTGIQNDTANTFYTYGNNLIDLNPTNISNPLNTSVTLR